MHVLLNDERQECDMPLTVAAFLSQRQLLTPGVALALNHQILPRSRWEEHHLEEGDHLLLFQVIAGG
ncbi:sulfur carrier protein ThiS [Siccibacter colletis]|jgi:sulfur carrier protein|uniref:Sulfur carrier protein ThiS n=1 Tax=Siccibacter colletis TaxID=1505757 RepID=A0ABY6JGU2_9ENTR|nr:sulfur carrier protein ThiS [Siccibacter colletis]UYU31686.1 sulfur carrier protein ThiS [Siccibacter colletis]